MPWLLRIPYPDTWYHVVNRARRSEVMFSCKGDYYMSIDLMKEVVDTYKVNIGERGDLSFT